MQTYTGRVVDGKVVVDGDPPPEGTQVTIQVAGEDEPFALTPDMEAELAESIAEIERGEYVTWDELKVRLQQIEAGGHHAQD